MLFSELPLKPELLKAVEELGFSQPTPVQEKSIPLLIKEDKDLIGLAQTGTGKTAAFGLPMIHRIDVKKNIVQGESFAFKYPMILKTFPSSLRVCQLLPFTGEQVWINNPEK